MSILFLNAAVRSSFLQESSASAISGWVWALLIFIVAVIVFAVLLSRSRRNRFPVQGQQDMLHSNFIPETGMATKNEDVVTETSVVDIMDHNVGHIKEDVSDDAVRDDLTIIEGIGPAMQEILNEAGIMNYKKLAEAEPALLKNLLLEVGLKYIDPTHWPVQARLAATGQWDRLQQMKQNIHQDWS